MDLRHFVELQKHIVVGQEKYVDKAVVSIQTPSLASYRLSPSVEKKTIYAIGLDKGGYPVNISFISSRKHMLWVFIRSALLRHF